MSAEVDYERASQIAHVMLDMLDAAEVPADDFASWIPERLSFLQAREVYRTCLRLLSHGDDVPAGQLARTLFEESLRWAWVEEDPDDRRSAFVAEAVRRHRQVEAAAAALGIEAKHYYGPLVGDVLDQPESGVRFPQQVGGLASDWGLGDLPALLYGQYRLLSQYTHGSLLTAASTVERRGHRLVSTKRLPLVARMTILRNAAANMVSITDGCKRGLTWPEHVDPLNFRLMRGSMEIAELLVDHAPASD